MTYDGVMRRLSPGQRIRILKSLTRGGCSMRATAEMADVSLNTVKKLLADAGRACDAFHHEVVRGVRSARIQMDEIWCFVYAKERRVPTAKAAPPEAGDAWTWTAMDADNKLLLSWMIGPRDITTAAPFLMDLRDRVVGRPQITSDGLSAYPGAVEMAFGADVDYAQLIKVYGHDSATEAERRYTPPECKKTVVKVLQGNPDPDHIATSYIERRNLTMRMGMRRFTRLTNAFSKRLEYLGYAVALDTVYYNFCRMHQTLRMTPAMAAGVVEHLYDFDWLEAMISDRTPKPAKPGPKPGTKYRPRKVRD